MNKLNYNYKILTPFKLCVIENFPFIEADFDAITNYQLLCKVVEYLNKTIDNQNILTENIIALNNWFNNLDVQDEIDNKLDEMAQSGELTDIIAQYLQLAGILVYDNLNSLKNATNVTNGSITKTLGYYENGDLGNSYYKIRNVTNEDVVNDMNIIALSNPALVAEFIPNKELNIRQFGCKDDENFDNGTKLQFCFTYANSNNLNIIIPSGEYKTNSKILINGDISILGFKNSLLNFNNSDECLVPQNGSKITLRDVKIISNKGIAYNMNQPNLKNTNIEDNYIDAYGYGILVNSNTNSGENLFVSNNVILSGADAIEINTTSSDETKFKNININNNILSTPLEKSPSNPTTAGFCIGVANGRNINITNNIIKESRREAIHIEDGSENIIISNNVLDNCNLDGIIIYANTQRGTIENPIINSNKIISSNKLTNSGINYANTTQGQIRNIDLSDNYIKNFHFAINNGGTANQILMCDGLIAENCDQLINGSCKLLTGNITLINTPKIGNFNKNREKTIIESINFIGSSLSEDWIQVGANNTVIIKNLDFIKNYVVENDTDNLSIPLIKIPKYMKDVLISAKISFSGNVAEYIRSVSYNETDSISNISVSTNSYGAISALNYSIVNGYLCANVYLPPAVVGSTINCDINLSGDIVLNNYNN